MSNAKELIITWFKRVWEEEDASAIDELLVPEVNVNGLGAQTMIGPEAFKQFHCALCSLLTDFDFTIDKYLEQDDWVSALCTMKAKSKATGDPITMTGNVWIRTGDGKLIEGYNHFDFMGLWAQLGYLPHDCFEQGLSGCKIR